ncbi:MAG TPA: lipopolysaccharide heptosyltransferase I [Candidatus Binatia bacterium]|nr:lipopolysaccharide heptosyltransferase I [Candidatus Binatia bacterium]
MKKIAIIRLSSLGDIVHTLPAFQLLRRHYADAKITWIVEAPGAALLENFSGIDELVVFNLKAQRGLKAKIVFLFRFVRRWRRSFDLLIDFQGLVKSALLAFLLGGTRLGFCSRNTREPLAALFYSRRAAYFPEHQHVIFKNIHLLSALGIDATTVDYPLKKPAASPRLQPLMTELGWPERRYIALNVGGGWPTKVLSAEQWVEIAAGLRPDYPLVLLWGNEQEEKMAAAVARRSGAVIAPFLNFSELIYLIGQAQLVISGDTLALHLADLTRTPAVGIFGPSSPRRNGPLFPRSRVIVQEQPCSFCYRRKCATMDCLKNIVIADIVAAAKELDHAADRKTD